MSFDNLNSGYYEAVVEIIENEYYSSSKVKMDFLIKDDISQNQKITCNSNLNDSCDNLSYVGLNKYNGIIESLKVARNSNIIPWIHGYIQRIDTERIFKNAEIGNIPQYGEQNNEYSANCYEIVKFSSKNIKSVNYLFLMLSIIVFFSILLTRGKCRYDEY